MGHVRQPPIITTDQWGALPAKSAPIPVGRPQRIIFHHTAGHHPEIALPADESRAEAIAYARAIQKFHMYGNGWNDSGHNFLVCRNGLILVGRHQSFTKIRQGRMVLSAHCPGQNDQVGIEHEHLGPEKMTKAQFEASARLCAWIIDRCSMRDASAIHPHRQYFPTSCPAELMAELPAFKTAVNGILREADAL
jgi:N-acetylmuramoyl-L-alanine amidase-like protein